MSNQLVEEQVNTLVNNISEQKVALVLFHNDLRAEDNATLQKAAELADAHNGRLLLLYAQTLVDTSNKNNWSQAYHFDEMGAARQQFLTESLADFDQSLQRLGNKLLCLKNNSLKGDSSELDDTPNQSDTFTQLCQLIEAHQVTDIFISQTADYAQNQAYEALQNNYPQINWHSQSVTTLFATMPTKELPQSFTQFRKKVETSRDLLSAERDMTVVAMPKTLPPLPDDLVNIEQYFFENQNFNSQGTDDQPQDQDQQQFKGGETNAIIHLNNYFDSEAPSTYKTTRNALDDWTHSTKFSAWLANGSLSVKILLNRLRLYEREVVANGSTYWIWFELLWREYFLLVCR